MASFKDKIAVEYPIPTELSIWFGDNIKTVAVESLDKLIEVATDEIASDILITEYIEAQGIATYLPKETITVVCAQLSSSMAFQGNRMVKCTFDKSKCIAYCRFFPATITYQRLLKVEDLDRLKGDQLIYVKAYILWKMAEKELAILKTVNFQVDNGTIDFTSLESFRDKMYDRHKEMKPEILIYSSSQ